MRVFFYSMNNIEISYFDEDYAMSWKVDILKDFKKQKRKGNIV